MVYAGVYGWLLPQQEYRLGDDGVKSRPVLSYACAALRMRPKPTVVHL